MFRPSDCSLVVCTKDRHDELVRCLSSFIAVTADYREIIVVDASGGAVAKDNEAFVQGLGTGASYAKSEPGLTRQRNLGASLSSGGLLLFVDDDVVFLHDVLPLLTAGWGRSVVGRTGSIIEPGGRRPRPLARLLGFDSTAGARINNAGRAIPLRWPATNDARVGEGTFAPGCFMMFTREAVLATGFDEKRLGYGLGEDADFCSRVQALGSIECVPSAVVAHVEAPSSGDHEDRWPEVESAERVARVCAAGVRYSPLAVAIATLFHLSSLSRSRIASDGRRIVKLARSNYRDTSTCRSLPKRMSRVSDANRTKRPRTLTSLVSAVELLNRGCPGTEVRIIPFRDDPAVVQKVRSNPGARENVTVSVRKVRRTFWDPRRSLYGIEVSFAPVEHPREIRPGGSQGTK